jgi:uncharacterized membrane protein required for colicin V production
MSLNSIDIIFGVVFLINIIWSIRERVLRSLMTIGALYLSTMIAGLIYPYAVAYFEVIIGSSRPAEVFLFWVLFVIAFITLEVTLRRAFPITHLPKLRIFDYILAVIPGVVSSLIIVSLMLTTLDYGSTNHGPFVTSFSCSILSQFKRIHIALHPWFGQAHAVVKYTPRCLLP